MKQSEEGRAVAGRGHTQFSNPGPYNMCTPGGAPSKKHSSLYHLGERSFALMIDRTNLQGRIRGTAVPSHPPDRLRGEGAKNGTGSRKKELGLKKRNNRQYIAPMLSRES